MPAQIVDQLRTTDRMTASRHGQIVVVSRETFGRNVSRETIDPQRLDDRSVFQYFPAHLLRASASRRFIPPARIVSRETIDP